MGREITNIPQEQGVVLLDPTFPPLDTLEACCAEPLWTYAEFDDNASGTELNVSSSWVEASTPEYDYEGIKVGNTDAIATKRNQARTYGAITVCLSLLERWLELGIRPSDKHLFQEALIQLFVQEESNNEKLWKDPILDDLPLLKELTETTRRRLWKATMEPCFDDHLIVKPSNIPGAEMGLFAGQDIPKHTICCYYYGHVHSIQSSQSNMLLDASYLLRIGTISSKPWWYHALQGKNSKAETEHDTESVVHYLQKEWDQLNFLATREFFVDPTNVNIKARYINDCLRANRYNVAYVLDPARERAAVVTLRPISAGEELYVSYGKAYWDSLEATAGVVPRKLPDDPTTDI